MAKLIQKLSGALAKKFKEEVGSDETVYFCVQGAPGNAFIGTDKRIIGISAGSFKGSISYPYDYDNIVDINIDPPLHGKFITLSIVAAKESKELKPKLYFEPKQKKLLREVLTRISELSNTYTYSDAIKEVSAHQTDVKLIVPMKNVLKEVFDENVTSTDKYIICVSIGDHQGLVVTKKKVLIFKINEPEETYEVGEFLLDEIKEIDYSVGLVTGHLQIIAPGINFIEKRMREQDLINVNSIICFSKKNYGGLMEVVYKKLTEILQADKGERKKIFQDAEKLKSSELRRMVKKKKLPKKPVKSDIEIKKETIRKKVEKDDISDKKPEKDLEEVAEKLSKDILEEIDADDQTFYTEKVIKQITDEVVKYSFPELASSDIVEMVTKKVSKILSDRQSKKKPNKHDFLDELDEMPEEMDLIGIDDLEIDSDVFFLGNEDLAESNPVLQMKVSELTELKNISGALLVDSKTGTLICSSIVDDEDYSNIGDIASDFLKIIKKTKSFSKFPHQWLIEYKSGLIYLSRLTKKCFLIIVGNNESNFGTLKVFIEKIRKDLKSELVS